MSSSPPSEAAQTPLLLTTAPSWAPNANANLLSISSNSSPHSNPLSTPKQIGLLNARSRSYKSFRSCHIRRGSDPRFLVKINTRSIPVRPKPELLKLALLNIRSLSSKSFYINDFISQHGLSVLFLIECWLSSTASGILLESSPPNYGFLYSSRQDKRGGGVASIFSNNFTCSRSNFGEFSSFEYLASVINSQQSILTVTIYRPPEYNSNFLSEFSDFMCIVLTGYDRIILLGDFNCHVNNTADVYAMEFLDLLTGFGLVQHVKGATHNHGNTLDLVFTKGMEKDISDVTPVPISDHFCVFFNVAMSASTQFNETVVKRRLDDRARTRFYDTMNTFPPSSACSVDDLVLKFNKKLRSSLDIAAPLRIKKRRITRKLPWKTDVICQFKRNCRRTERQWRKSKLNVHFDILNTIFTSIMRLLNKQDRPISQKSLLKINTTLKSFFPRLTLF